MLILNCNCSILHSRVYKYTIQSQDITLLYPSPRAFRSKLKCHLFKHSYPYTFNRSPSPHERHPHLTIRLFSEHQSIPADKTHSGFTKRWRHRTVKNVRYIVAIISYIHTYGGKVPGDGICPGLMW